MTFEIIPLSKDALEERLRYFEESHTHVFGTYLASRDFYEKFRAGGYDTPFGMSWATYFEAYVRLNDPALVPASA